MTATLSELVNFFCGNTKIAAMTFGSHIYHEFCFNCDDFNRIDKIKDAIKSIPYHGGGTHTGEALKCACDNIFTVPCGLPKRRLYQRCPAPIDVIIITDGYSNGALNVCKEAKCLHNHPFYNISTFSISVGDDINETNLDCIEDHNDFGHIFNLDSFDEMERLVDKIIEYLINPIDPFSDNPTYPLCYDKIKSWQLVREHLKLSVELLSIYLCTHMYVHTYCKQYVRTTAIVYITTHCN